MYFYCRKISSIADCDEKKLWCGEWKRSSGGTAEEEGRKEMRGMISWPKKITNFSIFDILKTWKNLYSACHFWLHSTPRYSLTSPPLPKNKSPKYWLFSSSALERRGGVKSDKNTNLSIFENVLNFFLFFGFRKMYFYFRKNLILPIMIMELWRWEWKRSSGTAAERLRRKKEGSRWEVW